jgi:type VI secretion system FHA domain protein
MTLTLTMLRCPNQVAPEMREVPGGEYSIGRGAENDWILADPERFLSKQHCVLAFRSGGWQIADLSTNGTFLNSDSNPIGPAARNLNDGDRLRLGPYEIEVRVAATQPGRRHSVSDPFAYDPLAAPPRAVTADPFGVDPVAVPDPASPFEGDRMLVGRQADPFGPGQFLASPSVSLPADYEPLAPEPADPFVGPTAADHSPHLGDAFRAPRATLPEDWDRDLLATPFPPPPAPLMPPIPPSIAAAPAPASPVMPAAAAPAAPSDDLLVAFLRGAGLEDVRPGDPVAAMTALGAAMRATVSGLRQALIARALVKSEFRIEQTMIRRSGNNPLKFSADDDDALIALLGAGRHTDIAAPDAIADALRDIHLHELATMQAMQAALRQLLGEFMPDKLREAAEKAGLNFTAAQTKARAWDAFVAQHARFVAALSDDFDSVFGRAFAQAYERAVADVTEQKAAQ